MQVALFGKFPSGFVQDHIRPKLEERGIHIAKVYLLTHRGKPELGDVDAVLCMHEMSSHGEANRVRALASSAGVRFVFLPRKSASWADRLKQLSAALPKGRSMTDENEVVLFREVMAARAAGKSWDEIAPTVARLWQRHQCADGNALHAYLLVAWKRHQTPEILDFMLTATKPWSRNHREIADARAKLATAPNEIASEPTIEAPPDSVDPIALGDEHVTEEALDTQPMRVRSDDPEDQALAQLFEEENARLTEENRKLKATLEELTRTRLENRMTIEVGSPPIGEPVRALRTLVRLGWIEAEAALDLIDRNVSHPGPANAHANGKRTLTA